MYDLIYTGSYNDYQELMELVKKEYPNATVEDGSDCIHTNRFSVHLLPPNDIEQEEWFTFIITNGFAMCSLNFQLAIRRNPDETKILLEKLKDKIVTHK